MENKSDNYLVFDCSTIGKPKRWNASHTDTFNWPRLVHLAYQLYDEDQNLIESGNELVKPAGFEIPYESTKVHGIAHEQAVEEGKPIEDVLTNFRDVVDRANYLFAFNMRYNFNVLAAEFIRADIKHRMFQTERFCIMKETTYFCKIPGKDGRFKWPTLQELHTKVFGEEYSDQNYADEDVAAASRCLFTLLKRDEIDLLV